MPEPQQPSVDATVEHNSTPSLADDLLARDDDSDATRLADESPRSPVSPQRPAPDDEDDFAPHERQRSRLTIGLSIAVIFVFGMLCGVLVGRALSPAPKPQIVYVLNDSSDSPSPTPAASTTR